MTIDQVVFPQGISYGASGGPEFRTGIYAGSSGSEQRNQFWQYPRRRYEVSKDTLTQTQTEELMAFFIARAGRLRGFLLKDLLDFAHPPPTPAAQEMGVGPGTTFQLIRLYTDQTPIGGGSPIVNSRIITRPMLNTTRVWVGGVELVQGSGAGKFTISLTTGIITLGTAAGIGVSVQALAQYYVPVRFDTDWMQLGLDGPTIRAWTNIPIVEVRE